MIVVVTAIERQIEALGTRVAKQIGVLVTLIRNAGDKYFFFFEMNAIGGSSQDDVAARCIVVACNGEVQDFRMFRVGFGKDRGPARVGPQRVLSILDPIHKVVAAGQPDAPAFVESVPTPVAETAAIHFEN